MILDNGSHVLVAHRRLFESDQDRFFVGIVEGYENGVVKASGYSFGRSLSNLEYHRKADRRTKILALSSGTLLVYELARNFDLEGATIETHGPQVTLVSGALRMDLTDHDVR